MTVGVVLCNIGVLVFSMPLLFNACGLFWILWRFCVVLVVGVCTSVDGLFVVVFCIDCELYVFCKHSCYIVFYSSFIVGRGFCLGYSDL